MQEQALDAEALKEDAMRSRTAPLAGILISLALALTTPALAQTTDDICFLHHSCGSNWLNDGLRTALEAKDYIDEVNDITYGDTLSPDSGRPDSLGDTEGDNTNMNHWILWFNDYLGGVKAWDAASGTNRIVMFKSCYPISSVTSDGTEPGDPFSGTQSLVNYKAVYRHPSGSGNTYSHDSATYKPLEDIFAENPDTLFIAVTAPSLVPPATNVDRADRARAFNNWLKNDWLASYNAAHPDLHNVAVYDWFDFLACPNDATTTETYTPSGGTEGVYPVRNMTRLEYRRSPTGTDSHPSTTANQETVVDFASGSPNFLDPIWTTFADDTTSPTAFDASQQLDIQSDGRFYATMWNFTTAASIATLDQTGAATLAYTHPAASAWIGAYLYDYTAAAYQRAWHAYVE